MAVLKNLRFGELAAESDDKLFNYFVVTPTAERIVTTNVGLVLGRKGSGKTAIFRQTEELLKEFGYAHVQVVRLNMDDHAWAAFKGFQSLGLSREHAATVSWQLALLLQLASAMVVDTDRPWSVGAQADLQVLRRFIEDNFGEFTPSLSKSKKLIGQFSGLKVGAFGLELEAQFSGADGGPPELVPALTDAISQHLVRPLMESAWLTVLDQLDESWDGTQDKKDLLIGLLKAVKRMNDDFKWRGSPASGARAVAFLRTDIHEALTFDDSDKHHDSIEEIGWDHAQLRQMLQQRLEPVQVDDIFESATTQKKGRVAKGSFNYFVSRTFMRPRDLIQFLGAAQRVAADEPMITRDIAIDAEQTYSRTKVSDLRNEYRRGAPWTDAALDALKQGPNKFDTRHELESWLKERIDSSVFDDPRMRSVQDLVEWLTDISVLGAAPRVVATETIQFRCEGKQVSLGGDTTTWIHPALFLGLYLFEPRVSRQA